MLILDVRVAIEATHEHALNEWYNMHVPRLVSVPGYTSGRRFLALTEGPRHAALYEIDHVDSLPSLLGADERQRHPLTLSEWADWDRRFVPHMTHETTNLYVATDADGPVLVGDAPIVEFRFESGATPDALMTFCDQDLIPELEQSDSVVRAARLSAAAQADVQWLETRPRNLLLVQVSDNAAAIALADGDAVPAALRGYGAADTIEAVAYSQIARHWPHLKEHRHE